MSLEDEVDILRRISLFAKVETSKLKLLAFTSERVTFSKNQELFHQGDPGDNAYVILKGSADVLVSTPHGDISVAKLEQNAFVGDISILCDVPRTATIKALSDLETLKIQKDQFLHLLAEYPEIAVEVMRVLALRLSKTTAELTDARGKLLELEK